MPVLYLAQPVTILPACTRQERGPGRAFTLVELMVVVAVLALLFGLLLPNLAPVMETAKMKQCESILHNIGSAMAQYVSDNRGYMMPPTSIDHNAIRGGYDARYNFHNLLAPYLGLGNCLPGATPEQQQKWYDAYTGRYKQFQCPSALKVRSPAGWHYDPVDGAWIGGFYMQNSSWESQPQFWVSDWPFRSAYFPKFVDPSKAILLYEYWSCETMIGDSYYAAQPYNTHFKNGSKGAMSLGRSCLYADWRVQKLSPGGQEEKFVGQRWWCPDVFERGNEDGYPFTYDGRNYIQWLPGLRFLLAG